MWLTREEQGLIVDRDTGEEVPEDSVDWTTEDDPDAEPAAGLRHTNPVELRDAWVADYYTSDPDAAKSSPVA